MAAVVVTSAAERYTLILQFWNHIMPSKLQAVEAAAMQLTARERAELAVSLLASINPPAPVLHPAWEAEIARRQADLDAGRTRTIPGEEVMAEIRYILVNHPDPLKAFASILREDRS